MYIIYIIYIMQTFPHPLGKYTPNNLDLKLNTNRNMEPFYI